MNSNYGATPGNWDHFSIVLGLTADLLPVVSNPNIPISPGSKMKALGKTPSRINGRNEAAGFPDWPTHVTTPEEIERYAALPDLGICINTRNVRAIDVDITDSVLANEIAVYLDSCVPALLPKRYRSNSSKFLLAFTLGGNLPKRKITTAHGIIELLATGQQFVAVGTHPSGVPYTWGSSLPDDFPVLTLDTVNAVWSGLQSRFGVEPERAEREMKPRTEVALQALQNDPLAQYLINKTDLVREVDTKSYRMLITCPNSAEHTTDSGDTETVYYPANTGGFPHGGFKCMHAHCSHITVSEFRSMVGYSDAEALSLFDRPDENAKSTTNTPKTRETFPWVTIAEYGQRPPPRWHIKHVLPRAELVLIYGASGSGKSFFALDLAMAICTKDKWRGHLVKRGRVAYVVAEGSGAFGLRVQAYMLEHKLSPDDIDMILLPSAPDMMSREKASDLAKSITARGEFDIVMIDTFAQVTPGANENSAEDMGKALLHCRGLHRYTKATVVLIHHAGKDASKGARGWSGSHAAADCVIEVARQDQQRSATVVKQKDGSDGAVFGFTLDVVTLGHDEDNEPITSCVLHDAGDVRIDPSVRSTPGMGASQRVMLEVLAAAMQTNEHGVIEMELRRMTKDEMVRQGLSTNIRTIGVLKAAVDGLAARGEIEAVGGRFKLKEKENV